MATMIPPLVPRDCASRGEMEVFRRLAQDPGTRDWTVFHSLGLAEHERQVAGEIDFVVVIPGHGVLCLEVKGCSTANLRRVGGVWYYGPNDRGDERGPFRQASSAMHSLRKRLVLRHPTLGGVHFASGVIFPFAVFSERSVEWLPSEVIDTRTFRSRPIDQLLLRMITDARAHLLSAEKHPWLQPDAPTLGQCETLRATLRPDFEIPVDARARASELERELIRYTEEQFTALDAMSANPRIIFSGPAGTGKTFLAIEATRRAHEEGREVLLVCYNHLLGSWLEQRTSGLGPGVVAGTLHRRMLAASGIGQVPANAGQEFWEQTLPDLAATRLLDLSDATGSGTFFDEIIVDEAQDLLRPAFLDFLDLSLRGGLAGGRWRMFGDFVNQSLYGSRAMLPDDFRARHGGDAPTYSLGINCRNTPAVAEWVHLLAGMNPRYQRILRPDDGMVPSIEFYADAADQCRRLASVLAGLERDGFRGQDIVVLSPRSDIACAAGAVDVQPWRDRLQPISLATGGHIRHATIHAFKGLEAPAIVVTDIETISTPTARALFYVALTRSVQRLAILAHQRVREEALAILTSDPASARKKV